MNCWTVFEFALLLDLLVSGENTTQKVDGTTKAGGNSLQTEAPAKLPLKCYDCEDTFTETWDPYTDCQINASATDVATCLFSDIYCQVVRVTVKRVTISMMRGCTDTCYYGCQPVGFGVTQLQCSSCCQSDLCNTGNGVATFVFVKGRAWIILFDILCLMLGLILNASG